MFRSFALANLSTNIAEPCLWVCAAVMLVGCQVVSGLDGLHADGVSASSDGGAGKGGESAGQGRDVDAGRDRAQAPSDAGEHQDDDAGETSAKPPAAMSGSGGASGMGGMGGAAPQRCQPPVEGGLCDPIAQCGCARNENCEFSDTGKLSCYQQGSNGPYTSCKDTSDCQIGYACFFDICMKACSDVTDRSCGEGAECQQMSLPTEDGAPVSGNYLCTRACNPAHPDRDDATFDACGPGVSCVIIDDYPTVSTCVPATSNTLGQACGRLLDCAPGLLCDEATLTCRAWCQIGASDCPAGLVCEAFDPKRSGHGVEFGLCGPPCNPQSGAANGSTCNTVQKCGCPKDQRCDVVNNAGLATCLPVGTTAANAPCSQATDCGSGYSCEAGVCKRFCDGPNDTSCNCSQVVRDGDAVPGMFLCNICNPVDPFTTAGAFTACPSGFTCALRGGAFTCVESSANGMRGAACDDALQPMPSERPSACAPKYMCTLNVGCVEACQVGAANSCSSGTCHSFSSPLKDAAIEVGACN